MNGTPAVTPSVSVPNRIASPARAEELKRAAEKLPSHVLKGRELCDLELILNGAFAPLGGFMARAEYESVLAGMRLPEGSLWTLPICLDIGAALAEKLSPGNPLALRDEEGYMLAVLDVQDIWTPDRRREAEIVFGTSSATHPGAARLLARTGMACAGGTLEGIALPDHYDFDRVRHTPAELRAEFARRGWQRVVAFHTSKPMHRIHRDLALEAAQAADAGLLIHPAVGMTKPGDLMYHARVHCYEAILAHYPENTAMLSLLPASLRMAGPREAIHNAIVRRNYGCTHMIVGPDHASPPETREGGTRFYEPYAAQEAAAQYAREIGIEIIPVRERRYVPARKTFLPVETIEREALASEHFTDRDLRDALSHDKPVPEWFSFPEVIETLRRVYPPRSKQGLCLFFTGLSGAGKSTIARILYAKLLEDGRRSVTLLDGDVVRHNLSQELGFSKHDRDINVRRIGFVASEIVKNRGIAICAPIAPYSETRRAVRTMIEEHGAFIEIYVSTPIEVCEGRDRKGLYAKARKGLIPEFTGVSDPYEEPVNPELRIDTQELEPGEAARQVLAWLARNRFFEIKRDDAMPEAN
jgi:sulfate adenylyltransferase